MELLRLMVAEQQAVCIVALLMLSVMLPLWAGALLRRVDPAGTDWKRTVWVGQIIMGLSGIIMIVMPRFAFVALGFAMLVCAVFTVRLHRQLRKHELATN